MTEAEKESIERYPDITVDEAQAIGLLHNAFEIATILGTQTSAMRKAFVEGVNWVVNEHLEDMGHKSARIKELEEALKKAMERFYSLHNVPDYFKQDIESVLSKQQNP